MVGILPLSWKQRLDGLNNVFLLRLRVKDGPLVMEPYFHITSVPVINSLAAAKIIGYCDCGRVISPGDGVLFEEILEVSECEKVDCVEGDTENNSLDKHILLRKIESATCKGHCIMCLNSKRGVVPIKFFGILNDEGLLDRLVKVG